MPSPVTLVNVGVEFRRGPGDIVAALADLSLAIAPGEYVAIVGSNGAGKSTVVNVIAGSILPTRGRVTIDGRDVTRIPDYARASLVARVFQNPTQATCAGLSVRENLTLATLRGRHRSAVKGALQRERTERFRALLSEYGRGLETRMDDDVSQLSGGMRQLLAVIMSVVAEPAVLLFDEHTAALDPEMGELVMRRTDEIIRERRMTAVMVTHNMRHAARFGDRLLIMDRGMVADDIQPGEKKTLDEDALIERFKRVLATSVTDRLIGG